jgi:hypothetical protein
MAKESKHIGFPCSADQKFWSWAKRPKWSTAIDDRPVGVLGRKPKSPIHECVQAHAGIQPKDDDPQYAKHNTGNLIRKPSNHLGKTLEERLVFLIKLGKVTNLSTSTL